VFFTPAIVSGTAKVRRGQFVLWNLIASSAFSISVAASSFGLGRVLTGSHSLHDIVTLLVGLAVGAFVMVWFVRHRRRAMAKRPSLRASERSEPIRGRRCLSGAGPGSARR
jgi:membrane protein DedA with SNARE-associated domain